MLLSKDHDLRAARECALLNCTKAYSSGDILNTFSVAGDVCMKSYVYQYIKQCGVDTSSECPKGSCCTHCDALCEVRVRVSLGG